MKFLLKEGMLNLSICYNFVVMVTNSDVITSSVVISPRDFEKVYFQGNFLLFF